MTVDDSLALLMLLHLPQENIELLGVTTTYCFTKVCSSPVLCAPLELNVFLIGTSKSGAGDYVGLGNAFF